MTTIPPPSGNRGDELLAHLVECLRLLDERVQVAVERAIAAREAGRWQTITDDETSFGRDH